MTEEERERRQDIVSEELPYFFMGKQDSRDSQKNTSFQKKTGNR